MNRMAAAKKTTKRINIYTTDEIEKDLEYFAQKYGVSKSSLASLAIGVYVENLKQQEAVKEKFMDESLIELLGRMWSEQIGRDEHGA